MFGLLGIVIGIILLALGGYMIIFFPLTVEYQSEKISTMGILIGFIMLVIGAVLVFIG